MDFRLVYRGRLKANAATAADKQDVRRIFHPQLKKLWEQVPLNDQKNLLKPVPDPGEISILRQCGAFQFAPLVCTDLRLVTDLDIVFLRPQEPGFLVTQGGDVDNRVKTLLDALRMPKVENELPQGDSPQDGETPFFCLLEDDALVTGLSVTTDRLLEPVHDQDVHLLIRVKVRGTTVTWGNIGLIG